MQSWVSLKGMKIPTIFTRTTQSLAFLPLRLGVGIMMFHAGAKKLFGAFGGPGLEGFSGYMEKLGLEPAMLMAVLAAGAEFFGGLFLIIGFMTRFWALSIVVTMAVAAFVAHAGDIDGMRLPLILMLASLTLVIGGAGKLSVDGSRRD